LTVLQPAAAAPAARATNDTTSLIRTTKHERPRARPHDD
jgi:hypothetical protein